MASEKPTTIQAFVEFYYGDFKPLYSTLQSLAEPPVEMIFEVNAAFDHLSRYWQYETTEADAVNAACAHLKRGCFDAFKIILRNTCDHYNELQQIDTSIIDNGDFDKTMRRLITDIRAGANSAKAAEGDSRDKAKWHEAYELWQPVYANCAWFDKTFYLNDKVEWARRKQRGKTWRNRLEGFMISIAAGLIIWLGTELYQPTNDMNPKQRTTDVLQETGFENQSSELDDHQQVEPLE